MVREDKVFMSVKELRQVHVIHQVMEKQLTQVEAGEVIGLSDRQVRRLLKRVRGEGDLKRVRGEGDRGLVHRSRGRPSNRAIAGNVKARVMAVYGTTYADFGPTLASEKLSEREGIRISDETLRGWLLAAGSRIFSVGSGRIGSGGSARRIGGNWSSWMGPSMPDLRIAGRSAC